jgi:anti-sigma factor ChrR (cupin superfamily)
MEDEMDSVSVPVDDAPAVKIGPGCTIRDLPTGDAVRVWVVDMAPGSQWPIIDEHPYGEQIYVVAGELIEDDRRHPAGTYLYLVPGSAHRPRTETGVHLFGLNPTGRANRGEPRLIATTSEVAGGPGMC